MTYASEHLNGTQQDVLTFVAAFIHAHGYAPSISEISAEQHLTIGGAHRALVKLKRLGYIDRTPKKWRQMKVLKGYAE